MNRDDKSVATATGTVVYTNKRYSCYFTVRGISYADVLRSGYIPRKYDDLLNYISDEEVYDNNDDDDFDCDNGCSSDDDDDDDGCHFCGDYYCRHTCSSARKAERRREDEEYDRMEREAHPLYEATRGLTHSFERDRR